MANTDFPYIPAGSKYHLYKIGSSHPSFPKFREFEFYNGICLQNYFNLTAGFDTAYGWGRDIGTYIVEPVVPGKVIDFTYTLNPTDVSRHVVTLTDNKSFVVFANCNMGTNQRSWDIISTTPKLGPEAENLIQRHMKRLGFQEDKFVFLRYEGCKRIVNRGIATTRTGTGWTSARH